MDIQEIIKENYKISPCGAVYGLKSGKQLKPRDTKGYHRVVIYGDVKPRSIFIHRLVAESFISNPFNKPQVNHKNGIKTDNRICNLEWCTRSENALHSHKLGLQISLKGEKHGRSKLTNAQALLIKNDTRSNTEIAAQYGVSKQHISAIKNVNKWKHI